MTLNERRKMLNVREAADYIRLSKSFLDKARVSGDGPAYLLIGRRIVYDRDDLDNWAAKHRRGSTSDVCQ
jgi:hypothetical protein